MLTDNQFLLIVAGYAVAGMLCLVLAVTGFGGQGKSRLVNAAIGVACFGYAGYLMFSTSESVWIFPYAMIIPFIIAFRGIRDRFSGAGAQQA